MFLVKHAQQTIFTAVLTLCVGSANAQLSVVSGYDVLYQHFETSSTTSPVTLNTSVPVPYLQGIVSTNSAYMASNNFGAASAAQQTLRASASLAVSPGTPGVSGTVSASSDVKTQSAFYKEVYVGAGTSGLQVGDAIQLNLAFRLDGSVEAGYINSPAAPVLGLPLNYRVLSSADTSMQYRIRDLDQLDCSEDCIATELARFSYGGKLIYDYEGSGSGDTLDVTLRYDWSTLTNVNPYFQGADVDNSMFQTGLSGPPGSRAYTLDTGLVTLQFDTFVGNTLSIEGNLDVFLQAYGSNITAKSLGDFGSSFDAELSSSIAGIVLEGELPGMYSPAPVPEAHTWAMLLAGLGLVGFAVRRRNMAPATPRA
jgi:hypothetical protein